MKVKFEKQSGDIWNSCINASQLAKMKKYIPYMLCHKIDRVEAVGPKTPNYTLKMWNFGPFCEKKNDILSITA